MENKKPENLTVYRKKWLSVLGGIITLLLAAFLICVVVFAYFATDESTKNEVKTEIIVSIIGVSICSLILVIYALLSFNNLRYPCILATDEKGIYDYSGFIHGGFISWNDVKSISGSGKKVESVLEVLDDGPSPLVRVELKNYRVTFANRSKIWRILFLLSGFGCLRIRTVCSPLSKRQTYALLNERLTYYTETEK